MIERSRPHDSPAGARPMLLAAAALALDAALVIAFVALGQDQHTSASGPLGLLTTALPYLIGLVAATAFTAGHRTWHRVWPHGLVVWLGTVTVGMTLRVLWGQGGAPLPFVLVTLGVLGLLLLGRRVVSRPLLRFQ